MKLMTCCQTQIFRTPKYCIFEVPFILRWHSWASVTVTIFSVSRSISQIFSQKIMFIQANLIFILCTIFYVFILLCSSDHHHLCRAWKQETGNSFRFRFRPVPRYLPASDMTSNLVCPSSSAYPPPPQRYQYIHSLKVGTNENGSACGRWLSIGI